jgi:putative serine-threonine protein kinase
VATDTVILWFPELSKESAKKYRLDISEITVE